MAAGKAQVTPIGAARSAAARATRRSSAPDAATTTAADLAKPAPTPADAAAGVLRVLPLNALRPADDNVRRDLGDLAELADSIRGQGILQLTVAPRRPGRVGDDERVEASLTQGLFEEPVEVRREEDADPPGAGEARQRPVSRCGSPLVGAGR